MLMRRTCNHAHAQDVRIAGECWHRLNFMKFEIEIVEARFNGIALRLPFNGNQRNVGVSTEPHDGKQMQRRNVLAVVYVFV